MTVRSEVTAVLRGWVDGDRSELEVWQWAQETQSARAEIPPADDLVRDIIDTLAALPFDMIEASDAEVMLDALANPVDETDLSVNLLWNHLDTVNIDARRFALREHPFYGQFCDGMD